MADISGRTLCALVTLSFFGGVVVGYRIKAWRVRYLQLKRDNLVRRLIDTQKKIDVATL